MGWDWMGLHGMEARRERTLFASFDGRDAVLEFVDVSSDGGGSARGIERFGGCGGGTTGGGRGGRSERSRDCRRLDV